ncbi:MAG: FtsX-like permease family protein [Clostridiaceae bacterium]|nr:FtsX-like permease family protein [Clostridiaceae bacterium]
MGIIFKFTIRNIKEKKFRTFLILFSIMISSALFFASGAMSGSVAQIMVDRIRSSVGSSEIIIHANEKSPSGYMTTSAAEAFREDMDFIAGNFFSQGLYKTDSKETVKIDLNGYVFSELQLMNPVAFAEEYKLYPFSGKKIILSSATTEKLKLKIGDSMDLKINDVKHRFVLCGIAQPKGVFLEDGRVNNAVVPKETLAALYDAKGRVSAIHLKPKDMSRKQELIENLSKAYGRYTVRETIPEEDIRRGSDTFNVPFMMMVVMVLVISVFIIYTSFRVITTEMLPIIGTFRSIGATKRMTDLVLLTESVAYGVVGGALGCLLGVGVLNIMMNMMLTESDRAAGFTAAVQYDRTQMLMAFVLAVALSVVSSIIPIIRVSRISVKDIVLNKIESIKKKKRYKLWLGLILLAAVIIAPRMAPRNAAIPIDMLCLVFASISVTFLIPYITGGFIKLFEGIYLFIFGNEGILAAKNLRENKSVLNNISLLSMGISALLIINTISFSVSKEIGNAFRTLDYDIEFWVPGPDRQKLILAEKIDGVADAYGNYQVYGTELADSKDSISCIFGAEPNKFDEFFDMDIVGDKESLIRELGRDRNIIISNALKYKFGVEPGDSISLRTKRGDRPYKIIGFCETMMYNGQLAIAGDKYLKSDMQLKYYNDILLKTSKPPEVVKENIKEYFSNQDIYITTMDEMEKSNNESNEALFSIFRIFSIMAMVIGVFGVLNNFAISFMERKRSLAMFRSMGMSKGQTIKMIFIEALSGGIIGGAVGVFSGIVNISIVPYVMKAIDLPIPIHYSVVLMITSLVGGAAVTLVASVSPALRSSRLNIIEAVKYE